MADFKQLQIEQQNLGSLLLAEDLSLQRQL